MANFARFLKNESSLIGEITNDLLNLVSIVNYQRLNGSYFTMGNSSIKKEQSWQKIHL